MKLWGICCTECCSGVVWVLLLVFVLCRLVVVVVDFSWCCGVSVVAVCFSVFSAVFAGRCASVVGFGGLSFVPRTFPCCLVFCSWVFGCFGRLGARTGSASVQTASGHCSGASQVRITCEKSSKRPPYHIDI